MRKSLSVTAALVLLWAWQLLPAWPSSLWLVDDHQLLIDFGPICSDFSWSALRAIFTPGWNLDFYPLRDLSYWLDCRFFGIDAFVFRVHGFVIFLGISAMIFAVLRELRLSVEKSVAFALLWMSYSGHLEWLVWISARKDLLAMFFGLLAVYVFLVAERRSSSSLRTFALVAFVASFLSKATWILMPAAFAVAGVLSGRGRIRERRFFWILASVLGVAAALLNAWVYARVNDMRADYSARERILGASAAMGRYVWGLFDWRYNILDLENAPEWLQWQGTFIPLGTGILLVAFLVGAWVVFRRRQHLIWVALLAAAYLPTSGLIFPHRNFYSTRYFEATLLVALIWIAVKFRENNIGKWGRTLFVIVFLWNIAGLTTQARHWEEPLYAWERSLELFPENRFIQSQIVDHTSILEKEWNGVPDEKIERRKRLERALEEHCASQKHFNGADLCGKILSRASSSAIREGRATEAAVLLARLRAALPSGGGEPLKLRVMDTRLALMEGRLDESLVARWRSAVTTAPSEEIRVLDLFVTCLSQLDPEQTKLDHARLLESRLLSKESARDLYETVHPSYKPRLAACCGFRVDR
jgi:hypothetical protein